MSDDGRQRNKGCLTFLKECDWFCSLISGSGSGDVSTRTLMSGWSCVARSVRSFGNSLVRSSCAIPRPQRIIHYTGTLQTPCDQLLNTLVTELSVETRDLSGKRFQRSIWNRLLLRMLTQSYGFCWGVFAIVHVHVFRTAKYCDVTAHHGFSSHPILVVLSRVQPQCPCREYVVIRRSGRQCHMNSCVCVIGGFSFLAGV